MSRPVLMQELFFSGTGLTAGDVAYFPQSLRGQFVEFTVYIQFGASVSAGKVQIETSFPADGVSYGSTWAVIGSTIDWAAQNTQKYASVTGVFADLRLNINTTVANGPMRAFVVAASHAP